MTTKKKMKFCNKCGKNTYHRNNKCLRCASFEFKRIQNEFRV